MSNSDEFLKWAASQTGVASRGSQYSFTGAGTQERETPGFLSRAGRFAAGAVEPLFLTQDAFFGLLAGARDQNKSPVDYWREMEWAKYAPWGATPERVVTGEDLLDLYGVENEATKKWGGIALDVVADPLLAGAWLTGIGKAAKALKAGSVADEMIRVGRNIDDSLSLLPITRDGVTRSLPRTLGSLANPILPKPLRENIEQVSGNIARTIWNAEIPGMQVVRGLTSRGEALKLRFGTDVGTRLRESEGLAQSLGGEVREFVMDSYRQINDLLGVQTGNWFGNLFEAVGLRKNAAPRVTGFRTATQETMLRQAQRISDNHGAVMFGVPERTGAELGSVQRFREGMELVQEQVSPTQRSIAQLDLETAVKKVKQVAQRNGDDIQQAEDAFRDVVRIITESDALVGYHLSMYEPIQEAFFKAAAPAMGYPAMDLWNDILGRGMRGENIDEITQFNVLTRDPRARRLYTEAEQLADAAPERMLTIKEVLGVDTLGEFLNQDKFFGRLDLASYVRALGQGHMRRSYAVMLDPKGFERYMKMIDPEDGEGSLKLLPSTVMDEINVADNLKQSGLTREADLIQEYVDGLRPVDVQGALMPSASTRRAAVAPMSTMVSTKNLVTHLLENGVTRDNAQRAIDALTKHVSGSDAYRSFIDKAREGLSKYRTLRTEFLGLRRTSSKFLQERQTIEEKYLEALGELANPLIALDETSRFAQNKLPTDEFLRQLYVMAEENGLVSETYRPGLTALKINEGDASIVGGFAGKFVSPYIEKELKRAVSFNNLNSPEWLTKISQFVRGSLLAGPNILTANLGGGIYTSSLLGINPMVMTGEMVSTLRDMARASRDPDFVFDDFVTLRQLIPLDISRMSDAAFVERGTNRLLRQYTGEDVAGAEQTLQAIADLLRTSIDNPAELLVGAQAGRGPTRATALGRAGQEVARTTRQAGAAFGLQGFATSESLMKIAAFRAAKKQGFNLAEAAEIARLSTFDYSELPDILRGLRDLGILMFPGFSYFIMGRNLTGAMRKPGVVAAWNRLPEAIMNAQDIDEQDRFALYASMPDWLKDDMGVPIRTRKGPQGEDIYSVVPLNQFLPMNTFGSLENLIQPFAQSIASLGVYSPFFELTSAVFTGSGEAPFSGQFGQRVFEPGRGALGSAAQALGFMYNNIAPTGVRKVVSYSPGDGFTGLLPDLARFVVDVPEPLATMGYDMNTAMNRRVMRDSIDNIISATFRSVQPVAIGGMFPSINRSYNQAVYEHNDKIGTLRNDYQKAQMRGDVKAMQKIELRVQELNQEFNDKWLPMIQAVQAAQ